jgi:hypothetical protein
MDELIYQFQKSSIGQDKESICHDIDVIMLCYQLTEETGIVHMLPYNHCLLKRGAYKSGQVLYADILELMREKRLSNYLLEVMPYIDDYIGYFIRADGI